MRKRRGIFPDISTHKKKFCLYCGKIVRFHIKRPVCKICEMNLKGY